MAIQTVKRLASKILKVGKSKVWIDPSKIKEAEKAITTADVKKLIFRGIIKSKKDFLPKKDKKEKKHVRKGGKYSIIPRKRHWINRIRPIRRYLKALKKEGKIDNRTYRKLRDLAKGGFFRSTTHLKLYIQTHKLIKEEKNGS
ncbi:MAG: 50S ribosomal protein L19e [Candidatus Aenigmatarchaeota archaeon]